MMVVVEVVGELGGAESVRWRERTSWEMVKEHWEQRARYF